MTSNLGSEFIGDHADDMSKEQIMQVVRQHFRPEFLNRLDEILVFDRLAEHVMADIVKVQLASMESRLSDMGINVEFAPMAISWLAKQGYDPVYGARPLKRVIQKQLENPLSEMILSDQDMVGHTIRIDAGEQGLQLHISS